MGTRAYCCFKLSRAFLHISFFWDSCQMNILLSNDDGIYGLGLRALYEALTEAGHRVQVVAPMNEKSGVGHSISIFKPLQVKEINEQGFSGIGVHGTPVDCVKLALTTLMQTKPDLVVSGINAGANVGPDILFSGTVAAATEGAHSGLRSLAISYDNIRPSSLLEQARHAVKFIDDFNWDSVPPRCVLNLNYPDMNISETKGLSVCPQTTALWKDEYVESRNPRNERHWWIKGEILAKDVEQGSDKNMLDKGYITLTPLHFEFTQQKYMQELQNIFKCEKIKLKENAMNEVLQVGDIKVELPIVPLPGTGISIVLFDSLGKTKLIQDLAAQAVKHFEKPDVIVCPEAKAIPLTQEMARLWNIDYFVLRKSKKLYMTDPKSMDVRSITTGAIQQLWYDADVLEMVKGKKVMLFDDVVSTGVTLHAMLDFVEDNGLDLLNICTIFLEGDSKLMDKIKSKYENFHYLGQLPILTD